MVYREKMWKGRKADYSRSRFHIQGERIYFIVGQTKVVVDTLRSPQVKG
jgi:hypothetical protein